MGNLGLMLVYCHCLITFNGKDTRVPKNFNYFCDKVICSALEKVKIMPGFIIIPTVFKQTTQNANKSR